MSEMSMSETDGENEKEILTNFSKKDLVEEKQIDDFRRGINRRTGMTPSSMLTKLD
jgi:hypothetical protein